jgi:hypothetical protein
MFLIAIGPAAGDRRTTPAGLWRIELRNTAPSTAVRFDAWIQRDEPAWNAAPSVQSFFQSATAGVTIGGSAGGLSNLATGKETVVVGATSAEDDRLAMYSSLGGRSRRTGKTERNIDTAAPADESQTATGLLAAAVRSFTLARMGGTSVAAPVAARRIYDTLLQSAAQTPKLKGSGPKQRSLSLSLQERKRLHSGEPKTALPRAHDGHWLRFSLLRQEPRVK